MPDAGDLRVWADAADADEPTRQLLMERLEAALVETTSYADELEDGFPAQQARISTDEQAHSVVRTYTFAVPGLLQTAEYARRLISMQAELHQDAFGDLDEALAAWMQRQQVLYRPGGRYEFVVPEFALRWRPGLDADAALAAQLHHLATVSRLPSIRFGVIPERTGASIGVIHEFVVYGEPGRDADVMVNTPNIVRPVRTRKLAEIKTYLQVWDRLRAQAIFDDEVRELLVRLAASLTS